MEKIQEMIVELYKAIANRLSQREEEILQKLRSRSYGDPFPLLVPHLANQNPEYSDYTIRILMRLDSQRTIPLLLPHVRNPDLQYTICRWIYSKGADERAIEPVIWVLEHGRLPGDRVMAAGALGEIGDERAIVALERAMNYDDEPDSGGHSVASVAPKAILSIRKRLAQQA